MKHTILFQTMPEDLESRLSGDQEYSLLGDQEYSLLGDTDYVVLTNRSVDLASCGNMTAEYGKVRHRAESHLSYLSHMLEHGQVILVTHVLT